MCFYMPPSLVDVWSSVGGERAHLCAPARTPPERPQHIAKECNWGRDALSKDRDSPNYEQFRLPTSSDDTQLQLSFVLLGYKNGSSRKPFKIPSASPNVPLPLNRVK